MKKAERRRTAGTLWPILLEYALDTIAGRVWRWNLLLHAVCWRAMDRVAAAKERIVDLDGAVGFSVRKAGKGRWRNSLGSKKRTSSSRQLAVEY